MLGASLHPSEPVMPLPLPWLLPLSPPLLVAPMLLNGGADESLLNAQARDARRSGSKSARLLLLLAVEAAAVELSMPRSIPLPLIRWRC